MPTTSKGQLPDSAREDHAGIVRWCQLEVVGPGKPLLPTVRCAKQGCVALLTH